MLKSHLFDENDLDIVIEKQLEILFKDKSIMTIDGTQYNRDTYMLYLLNLTAGNIIDDTLSNITESSKDFNSSLLNKKRKISRILKQTLGLLKSALLQSVEIEKELNIKSNIKLDDSIMNIPSKEATKYLMLKIHERMIELVSEIILMIENGFSLGANARWRTLNEYMVLTNVFATEDSSELVFKYLQHDIIGYKKAAEDLLNNANHKVSDYDEINKKYNELIIKYSIDYKNDYGWYTPNTKINFIDLATKYNSQILSGYVRKSNMFNHASSVDLVFQDFKSFKDLINDYEVLVQNVIINLCSINTTIMRYFMEKEDKFTASCLLFMSYFSKLPNLIAELYFKERKKIDKSKPDWNEIKIPSEC